MLRRVVSAPEVSEDVARAPRLRPLRCIHFERIPGLSDHIHDHGAEGSMGFPCLLFCWHSGDVRVDGWHRLPFPGSNVAMDAKYGCGTDRRNVVCGEFAIPLAAFARGHDGALSASTRSWLDCE